MQVHGFRATCGCACVTCDFGLRTSRVDGDVRRRAEVLDEEVREHDALDRLDGGGERTDGEERTARLQP
jgi:hypothetical protein